MYQHPTLDVSTIILTKETHVYFTYDNSSYWKLKISNGSYFKFRIQAIYLHVKVRTGTSVSTTHVYETYFER